jgi:hypothetical protein
VVAVVDTNCDPSEVDYVIPGNDDALRAIRLFASKISDSVPRVATDDRQAGADLAAAVYAEPEAVPAAEAAEEAGARRSGSRARGHQHGRRAGQGRAQAACAAKANRGRGRPQVETQTYKAVFSRRFSRSRTKKSESAARVC